MIDTDLAGLANVEDWRSLLSETERRLVDCAARGARLDLRARDPELDAVRGAADWEPSRAVRARVIEVLALGERDDWPLHHKGVTLIGARIDGQLNLDYGAVPAPLEFPHCAFTEHVTMRATSLPGLDLTGCWLPSGLLAMGTDVRGDVILSNCKARGEFDIRGARIGGTLQCQGARFACPGGFALWASDIVVTGTVWLGYRFAADGEVSLYGAHIGGNLNCTYGIFENAFPDAYALSVKGANVAGDVMLREGFMATGEVVLTGAHIGGNLDCTRGRFTNTTAFGTANRDAYALNVKGADVAGDVLLRDDFTATGEVLLAGSRIGGDLDCTRGSFSNSKAFGYALDASGMTVADSCLLGGLRVRQGLMKVEGVSVGRLVDDRTSWPAEWYGEGFKFGDFAGEAPTDPEQRIQWVRSQGGGFRPGLYTHLSDVFRQRGDPEAARKVLVARERHRTEALYPRWRRWLHTMWGCLSAYGYRPWHAVGWLVALIITSGAALWFAPMEQVTQTPLPLRPWLYAADLAIPFVDLRQASNWQPTTGWAQLCMVATIGLGWFFSGAFVVAVTGVFKPNE